MKVAIVSSSLNPGSRSRLLAKRVAERMASESDVEVDWIDLQEIALPLCDGGTAYGDEKVVEVGERMGAADAYVLASPVYNFDFNAAMKNLIELAGRNMESKLVGLIASAGGTMSYMSPMSMAGSLMLDFRTIVLPRFVYATGADWDGDAVKEPIGVRLDQFTDDFLKLGRKLAD